ncbi:HAMP domain-containing sensor histidine kinase [Bacillus sp. REN10]|uniref:sensor histidine kinase n=1 Tax=Bacillus sp. REN10 TaxID=2782541 RepID=UPI00193AE958|nr:HAMP domain-containing sensor histidine kinase [Bacillus sp. REN10]
MKTLYTRITLIYIVTFIMSLVAGVVTINYLMDDKYSKEQEDMLLEQAQSFIQLYQSIPDKELLKSTYSGLLDSLYLRVQLYDGTGDVQVLGGQVDGVTKISDEIVQSVQEGDMYKSKKNIFGYMTVGLPFQMDGEPYAVFVYIDDQGLTTDFYKILNIGLFVAIILGALLILIVSRYIVHPLTKMTDATKKLAKGQFDVQLQSKRKDEIGTLARSIDAMAKDLSRLEEMRRNFISDVSHEVQTPLTSIRGFSKALKREGLSEIERVEFSEVIEQESERLSRLCSNLLSLASLESDQHPFQPISYALDEQIRGLILKTEPQWLEKSLELEIKLPKTTIEADRDLLYQVWMNLLQNSIKYNQQGGTIRIWLRSKGDCVKVGIEDTGPGISKDDQRHIFDRFYRADSSRTEKTSNGIGLSIVKRIVDMHQGDVHVESEAGAGSRFIVTLPLKQKR